MIVDSRQQPMKVKLGDFGGAQITSELDSETLLHTFCYSSPELLLASPFNEAVDVWSLGVTLMELTLGDDLFIYDERYDLLRCIIKTLGQPPDHVLDRGTITQYFFNKEIDVHPHWILKSEEQYRCESNTLTSPIPELFDCFTDIESSLLFNRENHTGLDLFLDLIQRMLHIDPEKRIKPLEVLQHSFVDITKTNIRDQLEPELEKHKVQLEPSPDLHSSFTVVHENPKEKDGKTLLVNSGEVELGNCEVELESSEDMYSLSTALHQNPKEDNVETLLGDFRKVKLENHEVQLEPSTDVYFSSTVVHEHTKKNERETWLESSRGDESETPRVFLEPSADIYTLSPVVLQDSKEDDIESLLENSEEVTFKNHEARLEPSAEVYSSSNVEHESSKEKDVHTLLQNSGEVRLLNNEVRLEPSAGVKALGDNRKDVSCFRYICRHVRENVGSYGGTLIFAAAACSVLVLMRSSKS